MARMSLAEFEARYRADPDPWSYMSSDYERQKYEATLAACGRGPFAHALELGGSIGVFSELLAPRCERLTTIDAAPTAVAAARRRLAGAPACRRDPRRDSRTRFPRRAFDLVVASEILYYLTAASSPEPLGRLEACTWRRGAAGRRPLATRRTRAAARRRAGPRRSCATALARAAQLRRNRATTCSTCW